MCKRDHCVKKIISFFNLLFLFTPSAYSSIIHNKTGSDIVTYTFTAQCQGVQKAITKSQKHRGQGKYLGSEKGKSHCYPAGKSVLPKESFMKVGKDQFVFVWKKGLAMPGYCKIKSPHDTFEVRMTGKGLVTSCQRE